MMKKGFSLVELIIVVGVIAILATIGIPNYLTQRNKNRLELTSNVLVRELNLTMERSRSQEDGKQWWIHLDNPAVGNDFYAVCYETYTYNALSTSCAEEGGTELKRTILGAGVEFDPALGSTKDVVFSKATGLPTDTTTIKINLTGGADSKTITVNLNGSMSF